MSSSPIANFHHTFGRVALALVCALALLAGAGAVRAQEVTGTLTGHVTDQNGDAVPNAQVTIANPERGLERTFQTNEEGIYIAPLLPPGTYTITVEAPNFKRLVRQNVVVNVNDRSPIDIALQAGNLDETVEVSADAPLLLETPTQQGLIDGTQVRQLPLISRNFTQLATLAPGVIGTPTGSLAFGGLAVVNLSINGGRNSAVNYLVDGARNVDTGSNLTLLTLPSIDAIQEFTVLTSNYAPEFGRNGGGVVNVVTRQGTNDFNGTLYEFFRNDALNARDPFLTRPIAAISPAACFAPGVDASRNPDCRFKQPLRYNNFGGTIGGPVFLPRFGEGGPALYNGRNKTFFFFSQEFRRIRATSIPVGTVPTDEQRAGIFRRTTALTDPLNPGVTFQPVNGVVTIPQARINPSSRALLDAFFPRATETNAAGVLNQFRRVASVAGNFRQSTVRFDHNFSDTTTFTARYIRDDFTREDPGGNPFSDPFILTNAAGTLFPGVASQRTTTPGNNFVGTLRFGLSPTTINELAFDYASNLIASEFTGTGLRSNVPGFTTSELFPSTLQGAVPSVAISGFQGLAFTSPQNIENPSYTVRDNLTIARGSHTFKVGALLAHEQKNENAGNVLNGSLSFNGTRSGDALADFLLGAPVTYVEDQNEVRVQLRYNTYEFYAQDTWKITPRFTLDYGARYSIFQNPVDADDLLTSFRPDLYDPARAVRLFTAITVGGAQRAVDPANRPATPTTANTLPGAFVGTIVPNSGDRFNGIIFANQNSPFGRRVQTNDYNTLGPRVGFAYNVFDDNTTVLRGGFGVYYDRTLVGIVEQNAFVNPLINSRVTLDNPSLDNINPAFARTSIPVITLQSTGNPFRTPRTLQYSLGLQRQLPGNSVVEIAYVGTQGQNLLRLININQVLPVNERPASQQGLTLNEVRPFLGFAAINDRRTEANSNYNSAQVRFDKRLSRGIQFGAVYTFSKNIADASTDRSDAPQDPRRPELDRAIVSFDRTHVFTTNFFYELPFFRGRTDLLGTLLGGVQFAGIYSLQSGVPLTITQGGNVADPLLTGSTIRPDLLADPRLPASERSVARYFNTNAFRAATTTFGNAGRSIFRGPGINNLDFSVYKTFRFTEGTNLQFRAELFNALNHTQYGNPGTVLGTPTFGQITSAREPRNIQFALKFNY